MLQVLGLQDMDTPVKQSTYETFNTLPPITLLA